MSLGGVLLIVVLLVVAGVLVADYISNKDF